MTRSILTAVLVLAAGIGQGQEADRCQLAEAMFVYPSGGQVLSELHPVQDQLFRQFKEAIETLESEWGEVDLESGILNPSLEEFVLSKLPHKIGDGWEVYLFGSASVKKATLKSVRLAPGESGWRSFAGVLNGINIPEGAADGHPFGFALPCGMPDVFAAMEISQAPERASLALNTVISRTQHADLELAEHLLITVPAEKQVFLLGVARDEKGRRWLFLAQATNQQPAFVPFSGEDTNDGLFLLDASPVEGEAPAPQSVYHVLPDMNGNGLPEIAVLSRVNRIFAITPQRGGAVTVELAKQF
jgi:hypothetical protein